MPLYEYQCQSCDSRFEVMQRVSEPALTTCDDCGGDLKKLISAPAFQFKGSGWYVTDYAGKGGDGKEAKKDAGADAKGDGAEKSPSKDSAAGASTDSTQAETPTKTERAASKSSGASDG